METRKKQGIYRKYIKRLLDIFCSLVFLLLFWWIYLILAILVRIKIGSPVLFRQPRPGKRGEVFDLYKFRTMTDERDENGNLLPDEIRLTKFGKFLRSTSLDELPEIFLILNGKLSLIGPRPLLVKYLPLYNEHQRRRHEVRPGLTGYAQVHGRNSLSWEEKFELDVWYVDHITFIGDLKIIFETFIKVLRRDGISAEDSVTMKEFEGTRDTDE